MKSMMIKRNYKCLLLADVNSDILMLRPKLDAKEISIKWMLNVTDNSEKNYLSNNFDVILVDLELWKNNAEEKFKKLHSLSDKTPIIIIHNDDQEEKAFSLVEVGVWDAFSKTRISHKLLLYSIRQALLRKKTEKELSQAEERFKTLSSFAFNWEYWQDPDGSLRYVSPSCKEITGYSPEEFLEQPSLYKTIICMEDRKNFSDHYKKRAHSEGIQTINFRIRKKDGSVSWIEHRCQEALDSHGKFLGVRVSCKDLTEIKKADKELELSEERFQALIHSAQDAIMVTEVNTGIIIDANKKSEDLTGLPIEKIIGMHHANLYPQENKDQYSEFFYKRVENNEPLFEDIYIYNVNGRKIPVEISSSIAKIQDKSIILDIFRDISERKKNEQQLLKLSLAVEQSPASVVITNTTGVIEYVNDKFIETTQYTRKEAYGKKISILKSGKTSKECYENLWATITAGKNWKGEFLNTKKNGEHFWEFTSISPIKAKDGTITHFLTLKQDITSKKDEEKRLLHQANYDGLTDLPNRTLALDRIKQAIFRAKREKTSVGFMFIDLDKFKIVNDTLGHDVGDKLLIEAANRLNKCVRESDTVARFGGDEFLIVLPGLETLSNAAILARRLLQIFLSPFIIDNREIFIGLSIGITGFPNDGNDAQILLRNADTAMYEAKEASRNTYRFYTEKMNLQAVERMSIEYNLRHALEKNEFVVFYQPILDMEQKLMGLEVLLRWNNDALGSISPVTFIPLAEETGLIIPIGKWILEQSCKQVKEWIVKFGHPLRLAINVSSRQFREKDLVKTVSDTLEENNFPPELLELEITERLLLEDAPRTKAILNSLSSLKVRLSIDDFGTGYSALSYLKKFPFNTVKIDRSFVNDIGTDRQSDTLTRTIIAMANGLGLEVVGEGVEKIEQFKFLKAHNCNLVQGFYFSKPLPASDFFNFMTDHWKSFEGKA